MHNIEHILYNSSRSRIYRFIIEYIAFVWFFIIPWLINRFIMIDLTIIYAFEKRPVENLLSIESCEGLEGDGGKF